MKWRYFKPVFSYQESFDDGASAWSGHRYFAYDLIRNIKPEVIVELGSYKGTSFFSMCQAVKDDLYLSKGLFPVDAWVGDEHTGFYDSSIYLDFIKIKDKHYDQLPIKPIKKTFDESVGLFEDNSIDLLHIDGLHTYEAVKHDFELWLPKMKQDGVVLFHDIKVKEGDFGVYQFWGEIKNDYFSLEFDHSFGLGVLFLKDFDNSILRDGEELKMHYSFSHEMNNILSIEQKEREMIEHRSKFLGKIDFLEKSISDYYEEKEKLEGQFIRIKEEKNQLEIELLSLREKVGVFGSRINRMSEDIALKEKEMAGKDIDLAIKISEKEMLISQLEKQREVFFNEYQDIQKELISSVGLINKKDLILKNKEDEILAILKKHEKDLEMVNLSKVSEIKNRDEIIENLNKDLNNKRESISLVEQQLDLSNREIDSLNNSIISYQEIVARMQASSFWKIRRVYLNAKWAITNPYGFLKKYLLNRLPGYPQIYWAITNPIKYYKKYHKRFLITKSLELGNREEKVELSSVFFESANDYIEEMLKQYKHNKSDYKNIFKKVEPFAIYFPQFHFIEENRKSFYEGYHDMINLAHAKDVNPNIESPLSSPLGMYDLSENRNIIPIQIETAKAYGFKGFGVYYYWFSENSSTGNNMLMKDVVDQFFIKDNDGFEIFFIYANESWSDNVSFNQNLSDTVIRNKYNETSIKKNIKNLIPYFKNKNYKKVNNKPVFFIYHSWEMTDKEIKIFQKIGDSMLKEEGFSGLELVINSNKKKYKENVNYVHNPNYKTKEVSSFMFQEKGVNYIDYKKYFEDYISRSFSKENDILSVFYNFDNTIRLFFHENRSQHLTKTLNNNIESFKKFIKMQLSKYSKRSGVSKIFLVNSWNEWGEQMAIEPSEESGFRLLNAWREALMNSFATESGPQKEERLNQWHPKISIITPTFNSGETLEDCIKSIVGQSYKNIEHVIIDKMSTDNTLDIINKYKKKYKHIKVFSQNDSGIYDAMNIGLDLCEGDWVHFLGSDDILYSNDTLSKVVKNISSDLDVVYGNVVWGNSGKVYDGAFDKIKLSQKNICHQAMFTRKDLFKKIGKFNKKYTATADWEFNMRWFGREDVKSRYLDIIIAKYCTEGFSSKNEDLIMIKDHEEIVKKYLSI